ncbi:N-acetylneuraminate lyase-like isoform X2 [Epargyreus clarus]|uniref:N-acetylneuraminate lyase-like isoform X2 n=1 Tax=Epargyreus clarus TaxID=520877 RepID=UPI003C2FB43E
MVSFNMHGIIAAAFTPFHQDGRVNLEPIPAYAKYLVNNGIKNILVGGTTGEFVSLNVEEKKTVLDVWMKEAKALQFKVMVHVGGAPLPYVLEMAKYAEQVKVDAILTLPELYFKPKNAEELVDYLHVVANAAPSTPLVYYNNPGMSGVVVDYPAFYKLAVAKIPTFMGIKADLPTANQLADLLSDGRKIYITNHVLAPSVLMGHDSSIATVSAMFPRLVVDVVEASLAGDLEKARTLQSKLNVLVNTIATEGKFPPNCFVPSMKAAMEYVTGIKVGPPRLPQRPIDDECKNRIQQKMKLLGYGPQN